MREKLQQFMTGRYGSDKMNQVLSIVSLVVVIAGSFLRIPICYWAGFVLLIWLYFRMMSKNIPKRYAENQVFLRYYNQLTGWFAGKKRSMEQNKGYHIYKCPQCSQKVRIPKGKGRISIHCPKCGNDFVKRS